MRRKGAQSPLSLAWISPSINFHRKPSKDGVSCCRSTLDSFSNLVSSVVSPSVLVVCSRIFFSRAWFFCCSRTSWYWRAACFSSPLVDFFLRLLLFLLVLGLSSPLVSSSVRESSTPSGDSRVIGGLDSSGLMIGLSQRVSWSMRASRAVTSLEWPPFATDWCFPSGTLAAAWELCPGRGLMGFFLLGPLLAVPPLAVTLASWLFDEFQLLATHGDGPHYSLDHGSWNPGSCGGPPGQLVQTLPSQRTGFNTLDNWGHKTPTQSKRIKDRKEKIKGSWPGTCVQYTRLHPPYSIIIAG